MEQLICPKANESEAAFVTGIRRVPVSKLSEVVQYLKCDLEITQGGYEPQSLFSHDHLYEDDFQNVKR